MAVIIQLGPSHRRGPEKDVLVSLTTTLKVEKVKRKQIDFFTKLGRLLVIKNRNL